MRVRTVGLEPWRHVRRRPVASAMLAAIVGAVTASVLLMVGGARDHALRLNRQLQSAKLRTITVRSDTEGALTVRALARVAQTSGFEEHLGVIKVDSARNAAFTSGAPSVGLYVVSREGEIRTRDGRALRPGEVALSGRSARTLGMPSGVGEVVDDTGRRWAAVGLLSGASGGLAADLPGLAIALSSETNLQFITAVVAPGHPVSATARWLTALADETSATKLEFEPSLEQVRQQASEALDATIRSSAAVTLLGGVLAVGLMTFATTAAQRRDLARRRALGASRSDVVVLSVATTGVSAILGAFAGATTAVSVLSIRHTAVGPTFVVATTVLAVLTALCAAVPGAMLGALRDPATILRVP